MKRPTFFISSTIYDFRDLRSAIKFYLEEQGCSVMASEFNDFDKALDANSYEACLRSIHAADYFILLIGSRVGGWYDARSRTSITQREYREAYHLQVAGKLQLMNFVRAEVWQSREDRHGLAKYLESIAEIETHRQAISNYPSRFSEDAAFVSRFIDEVARKEEVKLAAQGVGSAPVGNWVHTFTNFRDVVDVLQRQIFSGTPVEEMTAKRLLRRELHQFVAQSLIKDRRGLVAPNLVVERFHEAHPITLESKHNKVTRVSADVWDELSSAAVHLLGCRFHAIVLPQMLARPTFLEFHLPSASYREMPAYEALLQLQDQIRRFNDANTSANLGIVYEHSRLNRHGGASTLEVDTMKLAVLLHLFDRWCNVLALSSGLIRYLDGAKFYMPELRSASPVQGMQKRMDAERPTEAEVESYVRGLAV